MSQLWQKMATTHQDILNLQLTFHFIEEVSMVLTLDFYFNATMFHIFLFLFISVNGLETTGN